MKCKKNIIISVSIGVFLCFGLFIFLHIIDDADGLKYSNGGRDTYAQFGDRRFVILSGNGTLTLYDRSDTESVSTYRYKDDNNIVENDVYGYIEIKPFIYAIGSYGYTKLNYENGELKQSNSLLEFETKDRKTFDTINLLKNTEDGSLC